MELPFLLVLIAVGFVVGGLAGFFGVGGGIVLVPILLWFYLNTLAVPSQVAAHLTLGTSLFITILTSLSSAARHYQNGHVVLRAALVMGAASILAALAGSQLAVALPGKVLLRVFAVVLVVMACLLIIDLKPVRKENETALSSGSLLVIGGLTGLLSAMTGLGGGVLSVPMMHYTVGFPMKKAVGTSSATIVITAAAAAAGYVYGGLNNPDLEPYRWFTLGYVDYIHSLPSIAGTLPAAALGAHLANRTQTSILRNLFAGLLFAVAIRVFFS